MKVLVLGAGATGGYFGGRLSEAGRDVSFLVRERRAALLRANGLVIRSPQGNTRLKPRICVGTVRETFDVVVLACKAYDLDSALKAITPAVGPDTTILPLLNGLHHYKALDAHFGAERVLGGLCSIGVTLASDGAVEHLSPMHMLRYGERDGSVTPRIAALDALFAGVKADAKCSHDILQALWEKWIMLASLAGMTCLMRANIGEILATPDGRAIMQRYIKTSMAIAAAAGYPPRPAVVERFEKILGSTGLSLTASMLRDLEGGGEVEADHIVGFMLAKAREYRIDDSLIAVAYTHLKAYQNRRAANRLPK